MQNGSVLSKSRILSDNRRLPCGSAGEEKRESFRTVVRKGYKPHSQSLAIYFLVCQPSPWWKARQEVSLAGPTLKSYGE